MSSRNQGFQRQSDGKSCFFQLPQELGGEMGVPRNLFLRLGVGSFRRWGCSEPALSGPRMGNSGWSVQPKEQVYAHRLIFISCTRACVWTNTRVFMPQQQPQQQPQPQPTTTNHNHNHNQPQPQPQPQPQQTTTTTNHNKPQQQPATTTTTTTTTTNHNQHNNYQPQQPQPTTNHNQPQPTTTTTNHNQPQLPTIFMLVPGPPNGSAC